MGEPSGLAHDLAVFVAHELVVGAALGLAGLAQLGGDLVGELLVAGVEVDVPGDQELAAADGGGAPARVEGRRAEVRREVGVLELFGQRLVLALADIRQSRAVGTPRGGTVKIDGDAQLFAHALAEFLRQLDAVVHGCARDRDERADVRRAHPRVLARVL
jgi:hypothetical protein